MQFFYEKQAGEKQILLESEAYRYLIKARRHRQNDIITLRNLEDFYSYSYKLTNISKKTAILELQNSKKDEKSKNENQDFSLALMITNPKELEKTLPFLNEFGLGKLIFVYGDYSQNNFKIDLEKFNKILLSSCMQSGRTSLMKFEFYKNIEEYLTTYPQSYCLNFSKYRLDDKLKKQESIKTILLGPEGGFSKKELAFFSEDKILGLDTTNILRAQSASICVCAKILL